MRLAANISWLFAEVPFLDRPARAASAGFEGVEALFPYDTDPDALRKALDAAGLPLVQINTPLPATGERGLAAIPGAEARFRDDFRRATAYARAAGAGRIHVMSGTAAGPEARATLLGNLRWAVAETQDLALAVEPLNAADAPGYFLGDFDLAAGVVEELALPRLGLQFDAYHAERIHGDVAGCWARTGRLACHVQVAGAPRRNEPDRGSADMDEFFRRLGASDYEGFVGAEYRPDGATADGLGWMKTARDAFGEGRKELT